MYGSSLRLVTRMPREARIAARDAAAMPFPNEETTPPVTKTNLVMDDKSWKLLVYRNTPAGTNRDTLRSEYCGYLTLARVMRMHAGDRTRGWVRLRARARPRCAPAPFRAPGARVP